MARPLRIVQPGCWYHVTSRGNERRPIFRQDRDRLRFLEIIEEFAEMFSIRMHAYVLMDNHYHLLFEISKPNLSRAVQWLNISYSVWFNVRHNRSGHLFQGRFKSVVVDPEEWGLGMSVYIHLNPVRVQRLGLGKKEVHTTRVLGKTELDRKQIAERIRQLRGYRWSSYQAYIGMMKTPEWLRTGEILGKGPKNRREQWYRREVERQIRDGLAESPWDQAVGQVALGGPEFVKKLFWNEERSGNHGLAGYRQIGCRVSFKDIVCAVERIKGESWEQFRERHGDWGRDMVILLARRTAGMSLKEIGNEIDSLESAVSFAARRMIKRLSVDKALEKDFENAIKFLNIEN